jgi:hypothetical protein
MLKLLLLSSCAAALIVAQPQRAATAAVLDTARIDSASTSTQTLIDALGLGLLAGGANVEDYGDSPGAAIAVARGVNTALIAVPSSARAAEDPCKLSIESRAALTTALTAAYVAKGCAECLAWVVKSSCGKVGASIEGGGAPAGALRVEYAISGLDEEATDDAPAPPPIPPAAIVDLAVTFLGDTPLAGAAIDLPFGVVAVTATPTPSQTPTQTPSVTPTVSDTPSHTPTPSVTVTTTRTVTGTRSRTRTPSVTVTGTLTPSVTPSLTRTVTGSPSGTPSATATLTGTRSTTPSVTPSRTVTPSVTSSRSGTPSLTPSGTPPRSVTPSGTPSCSPTPSNSPQPGAQWTRLTMAPATGVTSFTFARYEAIAMNDDGSIICVGGTGGYFGGMGCCGGGIVRSTNGGDTWAEVAWVAGTTPNQRYAATYRYMAADATFTNVWATLYGQDGGASTYGFPKHSKDGGATWGTLSSPGPTALNGLAVSADGRTIVMTSESGPIYVSIDGGASFNPKPSAGYATPCADATSGAAMTTNGQILYYVKSKGAPIQVSSRALGDVTSSMLNSLPYAGNQGAPADINVASCGFYWSGSSPNAFSTSHDGQLVIGTGTWQYFIGNAGPPAVSGYIGGLISISRDGGGTFAAAYPNPGFQYFSGASMSPDGRVVLAASSDDRSPNPPYSVNTMTHALWLSWDYGANWMQSLRQDTNYMWNTVRVSGDGATLFAGGGNLWKGVLGGATTPRRSLVRQWVGRTAGSQTNTNAGSGDNGPIYDPSGLAAVGSAVFVGARAGNKVLRVVSGGSYYVSAELPSTPAGTSTIVAGTGVAGAADGAGATATFNGITGLAASTDGTTIYISEQGNKDVRAMAVTGYAVTTLLGGPSSVGCAGGAGSSAALGTVQGVTADPAGGTLYVTSFSCFSVFSVNIGSATATPLIGAGGPQAIATGNIATGALTVTAVTAGAITNHMRLSSPFIVGDSNCNSVGCGGHVIGISTASCTSTCTATLSRSVGGGGASGATLWFTSPANGVGTAAKLAGPFGLAATTVAAGGFLYVAEPYGSLSAGSLRKVVVATGVTTEVKFKMFDTNLLGHGLNNLL